MKKIPFKAKINKGKIIPKKSEKFYKHLNSLEGEDVEVLVRKWRSSRTLRQNNYYWFYLNLLSDYTGYTPEVLHAQFKKRFLPKTIEEGLNGENVYIYTSTTDLDRDEFTTYLKKIENYTGYALPETDEYDDLFSNGVEKEK